MEFPNTCCNKCMDSPSGPLNLYTYFVGKNPSTTFNSNSVFPNINSSVFIGPFSSIIGDVTINENVFIACNVTIRADEGFPFYIGKNTNIQDGVIIHGLSKGRVMVDNIPYSVYIEDNVSCTHGCLIHGPCLLKKNVLVGFNSIVYNAIIGEGCFISSYALVTGGVKIPDNRYVASGSLIDTQEKADSLPPVPKTNADFAKTVQAVNHQFPTSYSLMFGPSRCSCGLCYDVKHLNDLCD